MIRRFAVVPEGFPARLRADVSAGFTVSAMAVPEAFACSAIAGVSAMSGLYALVPALILHAIAGGSRQLVVGPTPGTAALSAAVAAVAATEGHRVAAVALLCGLAGLGAGLARLGFVTAAISPVVRHGFGAGLAVLIGVGQIPTLLGLHDVSGRPWERAWSTAARLDQLHWRTAVLGAGCLLLMMVLRRWCPLVPAALVAAVVGIAAVRLMVWESKGVAVANDIEAGLPRIGAPAGIAPGEYAVLAGPALAALAIGFAGGAAITGTLVAQGGDPVPANRELVGLGLANLGAALCSGMMVGPDAGHSRVLRDAGARGRLGGIVTAACAMLVLVGLIGMFEGLPTTVIAATAIVLAVRVAEPAELRRLCRMWRERRGSLYEDAVRADLAAASATAAAVLAFGVLPGLLTGIGISSVLLLRRAIRPAVTTGKPGGDGRFAGPSAARRQLLVLRVESCLYFANVDRWRQRVCRQCTAHTRVVVLDTEACPIIDTAAAQALGELSTALAWRGIGVRLARPALAIPDASRQAWSGGGPITVYPTVAAAVADVR